MRVAARRSTRVGARSGVPLEDLGVAPNERYFMTRADLLEHNVDLITRAAAILSEKIPFPLSLEVAGRAPVSKVRTTSLNIDRIDVLVNGRPTVSADVTAGAVEITLPTAAKAGSMIVANGYREGMLVSSARRAV